MNYNIYNMYNIWSNDLMSHGPVINLDGNYAYSGTSFCILCYFANYPRCPYKWPLG